MVLTLKATAKATHVVSETYLWTAITEYVREYPNICKIIDVSNCETFSQ